MRKISTSNIWKIKISVFIKMYGSSSEPDSKVITIERCFRQEIDKSIIGVGTTSGLILVNGIWYAFYPNSRLASGLLIPTVIASALSAGFLSKNLLAKYIYDQGNDSSIEKRNAKDLAVLAGIGTMLLGLIGVGGSITGLMTAPEGDWRRRLATSGVILCPTIIGLGLGSVIASVDTSCGQ
jgi:hypothetical protein